MDGYHCQGFAFYSHFDSANLHRVEFVPKLNENDDAPQTTLTGKTDNIDYEFNLWTKPDCIGTEFENGNRTWFYFAVKTPQPLAYVKFNIVDINKQAKLYAQGMVPVYRIVPGRSNWERISEKATFCLEKVFTLSFKFRMPESTKSLVYFAFTYPFSFQDLQNKLELLDLRNRKSVSVDNLNEIYYNRENVINTVEGRRVDLITISSYHGKSSEREPRLANLFPDKNVPRPFTFNNKKVIFLSARVHPGETPSSFVLNGFLNFIMTRDDKVAQVLRRMYVFKIMPCLNPDGVVNGHYRTDTRGVNLNRMYLNPSAAEHPSIYAARSLICYYHFGEEREPVLLNSQTNLLDEVSAITLGESKKVEKTNEESSSAQIDGEDCDESVRQESGLFLYLDMHGHASKKGIFMYGNHFEDLENNVRCMVLPKLMSLNNHNFHFTACNFTERNMYLKDKRDGMSREGSGRVAIFKMTGLVQSYTLECNYNTGRIVNILPPCVKGCNRSAASLLVPPKYNPIVFEEVGRALGPSILDLTNSNPFTRLAHSEYHSLAGLRDWLRLHYTYNLDDTANSPKKINNQLIAQGKSGRAMLKTRSFSGKYHAKKPALKQRLLKTSKQRQSEKKAPSPQPSCSHKCSALPISSFSSKPTNCTKRNSSSQNKCKVMNVSTPRKTSNEMKVNKICFMTEKISKRMIRSLEGNQNDEENMIMSWESQPKLFANETRHRNQKCEIALCRSFVKPKPKITVRRKRGIDETTKRKAGNMTKAKEKKIKKRTMDALVK